MEIDEVLTPKRTKKIVSSTMVNQNDSSSFFGDVSELSSSGVPTISSGTMRKLAPIMEAIVADGEWARNNGHNNESQQTSPETDSLRRRDGGFREIAVPTFTTNAPYDEITPTDQYIITPVSVKKPTKTKRDPSPKLMQSSTVGLEGLEKQPSSAHVRNLPPKTNDFQSNVRVPRVAQQVELSVHFVPYAPPTTNANDQSNALVSFARAARVIQQAELSSALVRYVPPKGIANGQSSALVPFVRVPRVAQQAELSSALVPYAPPNRDVVFRSNELVPYVRIPEIGQQVPLVAAQCDSGT